MVNLIDPIEYASAHGIVYVDLRYDSVFKQIFGMPGCEEDLLYLLQNILPEKNIVSLSLQQSEQMPDIPDGKKVIYDIFCESADGSKFVVEMQMGKQEDFADRMVFYSTFPIRNQVLRGGRTYKLKDVYVIALLNFILPGVPENDRVINHYSIRNEADSSIRLTRSVNYVTVELPKVKTDPASLTSGTNRLLYAIRDMGSFKTIPSEILCDERLQSIIKKSIFADMLSQYQLDYIAQVMSEIDEKSRFDTAMKDAVAEGMAKGVKEGMEKGLAEGMEKGLAEGMEKGLAEGMEKGLAEGMEKGMEKGMAKGIEKGKSEEKIAVARRMLENGFDLSSISLCTGLPAKEIEKLFL